MNIRQSLRRPAVRWLALTGFIIAALLLCTASWWLGRNEPVPAAAASLSHTQFDDQVTTMTALLRTGDTTSLFGYAASQSRDNPSFARDCHPLMHAIGRAAFDYYGGFAEAMKRQNELCNSGFTHGIIEANFDNTDEMLDIGRAITATCPADATKDFRSWQCYHGIGHGVMLAEKREVGKTVAGCRLLPGEFAIDACVNGAYMERFIVVGHTGQVRGNVTASLEDCRQADTRYKSYCYYYAPSAYLALNGSDYRQTYRTCLSAESPYIASCVSGIGGQAMKDNVTDPSVAAGLCRQAVTDMAYRPSCAEGAIGAYIDNKASSAAAQPLCSAEFKAYDKLCRYVVDNRKQRLAI